MGTELDDAPIITIAATPRPIQWVDLIGCRYAVRRPKSVVESAPKTAIIRLAAFVDQDTEAGQNRAERRAAKGGKNNRIELSDDQIQDGMESVWRYLAVALDDPDDYAAIRRRVYGPDLSDVDADAHTWIHVDTDPNPDDDIDANNVVRLVTNLMQYWSPEKDTVKSAVKPAPKPSAAATTKRPAKRPAARR